MKYAVTGTPGVGKTSACALVKSVPVLHVNDLVEQFHASTGYDSKRRTKEVDVKVLARAVAKIEGDFILEGHFSHMLGVDVAIVLRCSPKVLERRLRRKGWSDRKIKENVEAEAIDVVLIEALSEVDTVCEIDTTDMSPLQVARAVDEVVHGQREKYAVGHVDWSQEVLDWF